MRATFYLNSGQRFNHLIFLKELTPRERVGKCRQAIFRCDCGQEKCLFINNVMRGLTKSCGCLNKRLTTARNMTHNLSREPIYKKWCMIKYRCYNSNSKSYGNYGARGIRLSNEWLVFENFYHDMNESYNRHVNYYGRLNTTIERVDNQRGYSKDNCRWATMREQANNTGRNRRLTWNGDTYTLSELSRLRGFDPKVVQKRLMRGWSLAKSMTQPKKVI